MTELDRISDLPDEVLCHILSFLPTKVACTTSVLSKRWTQLCHSLTSLLFEDDEGVPPRTLVEAQYKARTQTLAYLRFHRFVDKFMIYEPHAIKTFRLTCRCGLWGEDFATLNIVPWVEAAKRRCVEDFQICIQDLIISPEQRRLQDMLLSFRYVDLVERFHYRYQYNNGETNPILIARKRWGKRLHLVGNLRLPTGIFTCKTLVVLKLSGLMVDNVCSVDLPSLKTLHLMEVFFRKRKDLMMLVSGCPLLEDLNAPTINHLQNDCIVGFRNLPNLVKSNLRALHVPFTILYNVQFLRLDWTEYFFGKPWFSQNPNQDYYTAFPVFQNLIHIELCPTSSGEVLKLLHHCPRLQILVIEKYYGRYLFWPAPAPECIALHLRTCSIANHQKEDDESDDLKFAAYVMKNARHLQNMTIHSCRYRDPEKRRSNLIRLKNMCPSLSLALEISLTSCLFYSKFATSKT